MAKKRPNRRELQAALDAAMRDVSGHGVLYSQAVASHLGVNSTDLECLDHVVQRGPLTAGELARLTGLTTGAITGVIDRLERAGYARRTRIASDRRKVGVEVAPNGIETIVPLYEPMRRAALRALSHYRGAELELLLDFLIRARDAAVAALVELQTLTATNRRKKKRRAR
jgi:DNA-binding MarR family transcriptional regulator